MPAATPRPAFDDPAWLVVTADVLSAGKCAKCRSTKRLTVDHIIPLCMGGGNHRGNLQCLCRRCNRHKGSRLPANDFVYTLRVAA
ncbi:HNH endonuclease [Hymenobacter sp. BT594]|uniref:HNH endonuclease n=1 Tax=Hymenobacter guriensis TaxID=2793065 RepID=A0ABS0L7Q8_9BACT|nr:HNH endonuclease [Hymenobacter guriensis]